MTEQVSNPTTGLVVGALDKVRGACLIALDPQTPPKFEGVCLSDFQAIALYGLIAQLIQAVREARNYGMHTPPAVTDAGRRIQEVEDAWHRPIR